MYPADIETIQVIVPPSHYNLEHPVQPMQRGIIGNPKSPSDRRANANERRFDLINKDTSIDRIPTHRFITSVADAPATGRRQQTTTT